jgi:tetratricopeptide (TPR) repeat protein
MPNSVDALNNKANALASLGESIQPAVYYGEQLVVRANYIFLDSTETKSVSGNTSNYLEEAIKLYDRALSLDPTDVDILVNKGMALLKLEKFQEANGVFDQGLNIDSDHVGCLYNKGTALEKLGRDSEAVEYRNRAQAIDSTYTGESIYKSLAASDLKSAI